MNENLHRHESSFVSFEELGQVGRPYRPTFDFPGEHVDEEHERIARLPVLHGLLIQLPDSRTGQPVPGWLQPADARKLYELAYFSPGDILEIGSFHGLSTIIMSTAVRNADRGVRIHTVDLDPTCTAATLENVAGNGLNRHVTAVTQEGAASVRDLAAEGRRFGFAFVDHSHAYDPVYAVCRELPQVLLPGAFVLFHDYNDPMNRSGEYGVYRAVLDALPPETFAFYGVYGCAALYRWVPRQ